MNESSKSRWVAHSWRALRRPRATLSVLGMSAFFGTGIVFWSSLGTAMEASNTLEFCIGCHEMQSTVYQEYKETIHYANRTGVRAVCSDCHVPKDWLHKVARKIQASREVYGKIMGTIDTPEKFEAKRYELAKREWTRMVKADSIECRHCHHANSMSPEMQTEKAQRRHAKAEKEGMTCIECHFGIAHKEPAGEETPTDLKNRLMAKHRVPSAQ